ncbi:insulinase family protein [Duganella sp. BJB488]|uniref:M16 family metallopeptidase n=1 Tax=unclassified Duganella TaxID=2636909 RepID=UPI000E356831|nr:MULTISPECIES: pitrilysin family protein [unclassified Duganella]RFP15224.1 insulinase family protein [Duganella sp. BJB489]RFP19780.1 insulinase family protein [Duganella sp. BJB488]RFP38167.1 insulinase family protein [Duganella sp. BJB480]
MKWKVLAASLMLGMAATAHAVTADEVHTFTLANGMKFIVLESHTIPNANMYTFWKVGSRNEAPGITGLSHFFEHMMFNGSRHFGPKMFDRTMEAKGGSNNAYTSNDLTVYQDWFPAASLETIFTLESDRIAHLTIDPKMVASERGVVLSERSTGLENSNIRALHEEVNGVAFQAHPYSWPVIGHESDIKAWTQDDLQRYFNTYYAPNNAVSVIVGDVKADEVKKLATKYFGGIPKRALPPAVRTVEPEQKGERRVFVAKESATSANLAIAYKVPAANSPDFYALEVLQSILGEGKTSRLYKALVEQQLATQVSASSMDGFDPGLLYLSAVATAKTPPAQLEQALLAEVDNLVKNGVTADELQKVKNQKLLNLYREQETINGRAQQLGNYEVFFGDYKKMFDAPAAYEKLTPADIQAVAAKYLKKSQRTVGVLAAKED